MRQAGYEPVLLTESFSHYSPAKSRHKAAFSNELLKHLPATPSASLPHKKLPERTLLPDAENDSFPIIHLRRGRSAYRASKYPRIALSPELDRKMKLIAGYQLLMDLEVAEDKGISRPILSPEAKKRTFNQDSREFLKLKRSLLAIKRCEVCHNTYCLCQKQVQDKSLMRITKRFERLRRRVGNDTEAGSLSQTKSLSAMRTHRKSPERSTGKAQRMKDTESSFIFKTSPHSEILNVDTGKPRGRDVHLKAYGHSIHSASSHKPS